MRGMLAIRAGYYRIDDFIDLVVHASDGGTVFTIHYLRIGKRYTAVIDEDGAVVSRVISGRHSRPLAFPRYREPQGRRTARKASRIRFVIQYGPSRRPRNVAYVLGGYADGFTTHVLYRICGGGKVNDQILAIASNLICLGESIPIENRLAPDRWDEFLALPDESIIQLTRVWRKLSLTEIADLVSGQVFQVGPVTKTD